MKDVSYCELTGRWLVRMLYPVTCAYSYSIWDFVDDCSDTVDFSSTLYGQRLLSLRSCT